MSQVEYPLRHSAGRTAVPKQVPIFVAGDERSEDVRIVELTRLAQRDDWALRVAPPLLLGQPGSKFGGRIVRPFDDQRRYGKSQQGQRCSSTANRVSVVPARICHLS